MVPTLPTGVHTCMKEDWNGYRAARLSSESANIVKISILHSMKLYQLWVCIVVYGHYTDNIANITGLLCVRISQAPSTWFDGCSDNEITTRSYVVLHENAQ